MTNATITLSRPGTKIDAKLCAHMSDVLAWAEMRQWVTKVAYSRDLMTGQTTRHYVRNGKLV